MSDQWRVYYRTGGTANFKWHFVGEIYDSYDAAVAEKESLQRMGYPAYVESRDLIEYVGLPEKYEENFQLRLEIADIKDCP